MVKYGNLIEVEAEKSKRYIPKSHYVDYPLLREAVYVDKECPEAFWAKWDAELARVRDELVEMVNEKKQCCSFSAPGTELACFRKDKISRQKLEALCMFVEVNREGFRKIAKKYDKVAGGAEQNPRLLTFDTLLKEPLDTLEFLDYLGHGIEDSKTMRLLGWFGVFVVIVLVFALLIARPSRVATVFFIGMFAAFMMAWANAANDIANSVGTSVGAGALTLRQAVVWGCVFEVLGCLTLGPLVAKSISKDIVETASYGDSPDLFAFMMLCVLVGGAFTTLLATAYGFPISATHSVIGGLVAVGIASHGGDSVNWTKLGFTAIGWVAAPLTGALVAGLLYLFIRLVVHQSKDAPKRSRLMQPVFFWICISTNVCFLFMKGPKVMRIKPIWLAVIMAVCIGLAVTILVGVLRQLMIKNNLWMYKKGQEKEEPKGTPTPAAPREESGTEVIGKTVEKETASSGKIVLLEAQETQVPEDTESPGQDTKGRRTARANSGSSGEDEWSDGTPKKVVSSVAKSLDDREAAPLVIQVTSECPDCLGDSTTSPYCPQTGKPHTALCPTCKRFLSASPFCSQTGASHKLPKPRKQAESSGEEEVSAKAGKDTGSPVSPPPPGKETGSPNEMEIRPITGSYSFREHEYKLSGAPISRTSKFRKDKRIRKEKKSEEVEPLPWQVDEHEKKVEAPFVPLLIVSALSVAFAHGGNDVGNAVGPLATILGIHETGEIKDVPDIPFWALFVGAAGFVVGIVTMGSLTIVTVGTKITTLTPSKSFATQIGAAVAVLGSSALKLPVSTSHCLVGAVLGIGLAQWVTGSGQVNVRVLNRIFLAWVITIPIAMICTLIVFWPFAKLYMD